MSIQETVAVVVQVLPAVSVKLKVNEPLPVNVYMPVPTGFWKFRDSEGEQVTVTFWLVEVAGE